MPNHCENRWTISGELSAIKEFTEAALKTNEDGQLTFSFESLVPMPELLKKTSVGRQNIDGVQTKVWIRENEVDRLMTPEEQKECQRLGAEDWHDWALKNWGTKWDAYDVDVIVDEQCVEIIFTTAWGPPRKFYNYVEERFPDLFIAAFYHEPGCCMAGYLNE